jgi:hypothetical protein
MRFGCLDADLDAEAAPPLESIRMHRGLDTG